MSGKPTVRALGHQYHERLRSLKDANPLDGAMWYPWASLAAIDTLDGFLGGEVEKLRGLMGSSPVLDVGCGDGDVAFFLETLGASRVDCVDHAPTNYNGMMGVRRMKQLLGSPIGIHAVDLDQRPGFPGSGYGLALLLGVLYHLKNPFLVLETLARNSRHLFLSTRIASLAPGGNLDFGAFPLAYLVDDHELNQDNTNFWIFSETALKRLVRRAGWDVRSFGTVGAKPSRSDPVTPEGDTRAYLLAESRLARPAAAFRLDRGWHELEYESWRWTARRFSAVVNLTTRLAPATLLFRFRLPREVLEQRPALALSAAVNGAALAPAIYSTAGEHEYSAALPSLEAGQVKVEFELDGAIRAGGGDERELGVLVTFVGESAIELS
jgi:tRNA (mo5U34)-methyltransferase